MRDGLKNRVNGNQYYLETNTLSQILYQICLRERNLFYNPDRING